MRSPSRRNSVLASEQSPQKTPAAVEIDEQRGHRVEEPVAIRAGTQREAHQQAPVLDRVAPGIR